MGAAEIVVTVVATIACLGMGVFLGSLPFKRDELTECMSNTNSYAACSPAAS